MIPLKINYRTLQGKAVTPQITIEQRVSIETTYTNYLQKNKQIISPQVDVLMSADGSKVIRCWIIADGVLCS